MPPHLFVVWAPDYTDSEAYQRRVSVRPRHLERAAQLKAQNMKISGPMLSPESLEEGVETKIVGSMMVFEAASIQEVRDIIEADLYWTRNVWDKEKMVILPWINAQPTP